MQCRRNPYFIGINSAIWYVKIVVKKLISRNPYFIGINSAIKEYFKKEEEEIVSQSLFYWN